MRLQKPEVALHVLKGASRMGRPVIGQLYALERPDVGGYFRARVCSCDGKMVQATLVDYTATVSIEKVYSLPDRLVALPPLAMRCSMSRQIVAAGSGSIGHDENVDGQPKALE